jgi:hypothetical protein
MIFVHRATLNDLKNKSKGTIRFKIIIDTRTAQHSESCRPGKKKSEKQKESTPEEVAPLAFVVYQQPSPRKSVGQVLCHSPSHLHNHFRITYAGE